MEFWANKVAVVTGAGAGIGAKIAEELARHGLTVIGLDYKEEKIEQMLIESNRIKSDQYSGILVPRKCDVSKQNEIEVVFDFIVEKYGGVDILINNVGICREGLFSTMDMKLVREVMDTNLFGLTLCTRKTIDSVVSRNGRGHIVMINSICGHYMPSLSKPMLNMYLVTKCAMTAMTDQLRHEFRYLNYNIKITSVSPGLVRTGIFEASKTEDELPNEFDASNRMLEVKDVSDAVLYALGTPPQVQVHEIILRPLHESL